MVAEVGVLGGEVEELIVIEEAFAVADSEDEVDWRGWAGREQHGAEGGDAGSGGYEDGIRHRAPGDEGSVGTFESDFIAALEAEEMR